MRKDIFFNFMIERHSMWYDRFILKNNPPWTTDPILLTTKYTNVYRELDRNTVWFIINLAEVEMDLPTKIFNTLVYTLINNPETLIGAGGFPTSLEEVPMFLESLVEYEKFAKRNGIVVFTNGYFTRPLHHGVSKLQGYAEDLFQRFYVDHADITNSVGSGTPDEFFTMITKYHGVGDFVAYEIYCNLVHLGINDWDFNSFVNIGPGALEGLYRVFGKETVKGVGEKKSLLKTLQKEFPLHVKATNAFFPYLYGKEEVHLRVIEHSLCEFHKYCTQLDSNNKGRRIHYTPKPLDHDDYLVSYYDSMFNNLKEVKRV